MHQFKRVSHVGVGIPIFVLMILGMMILPLPPMLLDIFFTFNITLSLLVLLAGTYAARPLDFSIFPMILLLTTLLRLALNIASTRVVLLEGHTGTDAAGQVVESFGKVVIGGNYTVGFVIFMILVIINFIVVTKGASRISEVNARFTLDSMPGKQMAVDADLGSGSITQEEAKARRAEIANEADFYGAMDGASKFVRGDAIAGILILLINIIGGFIIGVAQHDLTFGDAFRVYGLLTIGDGLVAQIPSLLLSTSAAIMVTRVSSTQDLSAQVKSQVFSQLKPLGISSVVLGVLGIIPGMPHFVFISISALLGWSAYYLKLKAEKSQSLAVSSSEVTQNAQSNTTTASLPGADQEAKEITWEDIPVLDQICLEVGYKLIPFVDASKNKDFFNRIKGVRKKLTQDLGFLIPTVHIRDDLNLPSTGYKISLSGITFGEGEVRLDMDFAINPGKVFGNIEGIPTKEPAFGLDALWIHKGLKEEAQTLGYTVVDVGTLIATHLSQIIQENAFHMLGYQEAQKLLDMLAKSAPKLVEDLIPDKLPLGVVVKILQNLLEEGVPIKDTKSIMETLSEYASKSQDPNFLTEVVRMSLKRFIVQKIIGTSTEIPVMTIEPNLEQILLQSLHTRGEMGSSMDPILAEKMQESVMQYAKKQEVLGNPVVLLVHPSLRKFIAKLCKNTVKSISVLSFQEIPDDKKMRIQSTLGQ